MTDFIQLHLLTSYPPANLNRDDLGRPKTAVMGGAMRLRISSQSLKRAWRTSEVFESALAGHVGTRTREMGSRIMKALVDKGVKEKDALAYAKTIARVFGKLKDEKGDSAEISQLAHFGPDEIQEIDKLIEALAKRKSEPIKSDLDLLRKTPSAADIALFGRMLADATQYNVDAAAQVAHAISIHKVAVEDDFFTAVDDLNSGEEDMGAGHMGDTEFAAGLFYQYVCINRSLLDNNLAGDKGLADSALRALIEAVATVAPTGKQNSFASRARASYILCEVGDQQPRSLSVAFIEPVWGDNILQKGIASLESTLTKMDAAYGPCATDRAAMNLLTGEGTLNSIVGLAIKRRA